MNKVVSGVIVVLLLLFVAIGASFVLSTPDRPTATPSLGSLASPSETFDPVFAGEPLPTGFRQLLPRDAILPVYDPEFVSADEIGWRDSTLVIGLEIDGDARAYPVGHLNRREMVIDSVAGIPVLVTW